MTDNEAKAYRVDRRKQFEHIQKLNIAVTASDKVIMRLLVIVVVLFILNVAQLFI